MPLVDPRSDQLVVRIVYDGPAYAGKTTTLRALAGSLGGELFSAGEADGRTLYFDWVDYLGGRFEGMPIRCQIVAVPGQRVLVRRRRMLLATADAAVFVADSQRAALAENRHAFGVLREVLSSAQPPFGVVAQANKRDLPDIVGLDELRAALLGGDTLAVTESIAERNEGVRETFVLAVRLALDRVRQLGATRMLPRLAPEIADGPQLLDAMRAVEEGAEAALARVFLGVSGPDRRAAPGEAGVPAVEETADRAAEASGSAAAGGALAHDVRPDSATPAAGLPAAEGAGGRGGPGGTAAPGGTGVPVETAEPVGPAKPGRSGGPMPPGGRVTGALPAGASPAPAPAGRGGPQLPDAAVPPGLVWPPVAGRVVLHEAMRQPPELAQTRQGDWIATSAQWFVRSSLESLFFDLDAGRGALVAWARWHTAAAHRLSAQRCVVLARAAPWRPAASGPGGGQDGGAWRLWQIVHRTRSLADDCLALFAVADDNALGAGLLRVAELRVRAERDLRASGWLRRLDLRSVGASPERNPVFTGFAPFLAETPGPPDETPIDPAAILRADLGPLLRTELAQTPRRLPGVLEGLRRAAVAQGLGDLGGILQRLLLES